MSHNTIPSAQPPARRNQLDVLEDIAASTAAMAEGGGGAGGPDREFIVSYFRATNAFTGASVGDLIRSVAVYDLSGTDPVQVGTTDWSNETTQLPLASAPSPTDLEPAMGGSGVSNAELVAALATQTGTKTTASAALPAGGSGFIGWLSNLYHSFFGVASGTADSGNPVKTGGRYASAALALTNGQRSDTLVSLRGSTLTATDFGSSSVGDAITQTTARYQTDRTGADSVPLGANLVFDATGPVWVRQRGSVNGTWMQGNVASGVADTGNPVKMGAVYRTAPPTFADGQRGDLQVDVNGGLMVTNQISSQAAGDAVPAAQVAYNYTRSGGYRAMIQAGLLWNGTTYDRASGNTAGAFMQGNVADGIADAGNSVKVGGVYRSASPNLSNGQRSSLELTSGGLLKVQVTGTGGVPGVYNGGSDSVSSAALGLASASFNYVFNGSSFDRMRGDVTGLAVNMLKRPLVARQIAVSSGSNPVALTAGVKRVSIYARGCDTRFRFENASPTAVATDHFIAQGERLDLNCEVGATPWIAVIRDGATDGTLELSELS